MSIELDLRSLRSGLIFRFPVTTARGHRLQFAHPERANREGRCGDILRALGAADGAAISLLDYGRTAVTVFANSRTTARCAGFRLPPNGFSGRVVDMRALGDHEKSPFGRQVYSSAGLGGNTRQGWQGLVNNLYGLLDLDIQDNAAFRGEILRSSAGRMELTEIFTAAEVAHRRKQHIAKDNNDFFLFGLSISGSADYEQYGRESVMKPQHFGLLYTAAPYRFRHSEDIHRICLKIPASALQARVGDVHALCSVARPVSQGLPRLVADLLISMARQADHLGDGMIPVVEANTLDLIGLLLGSGRGGAAVPGTSVRWAIHRRACALMTEALQQPELNPEKVAAGVGVSTRYLHRVFEDAEETVAETLIRLRLERCRSMLADPALRPLSVKEIAFRNGFKSQSHCASAFKSRYGVTPTEVRQAAP